MENDVIMVKYNFRELCFYGNDVIRVHKTLKIDV